MPFSAAAAIGLGSAVIGAGASIYGANQQSKAVKKGADQANQLQREAMAQSRADLTPYMQTGGAGLGAIGNLSGANGPEAAQAAMQNFQTSPGYQFQVDEGMRAVNANASAAGMSNSGATMKALQARGQGLANQDFTAYYNRLAGLAQMGQSSAAGVGAQGVQTAGSMAQTATSLGSAQASIYGNQVQGVGNAIGNGLNQGMYAYQSGQQNQLFNPQAAQSFNPMSPSMQPGDMQYYKPTM